MMDAVALRTLKDKTQPVRRRHIPVVKQLGQASEEHGQRRSFRLETDQQIYDGAGEHAVGQNLDGMLVKAGDYFDALRTMVYLVQPAPQEVDLVPPAVPPVVN